MRPLLCLFLAVFFAACDGETGDEPQTIPEKRIAPEARQAPDASSNERFGLGNPRPSETSSEIGWTAPETWRTAPDRPMRLATFHLDEEGSAECYLTILPGNAGGVAANLNRWRQQMGQPPLSESEIAELPEHEVLGRSAKMIEVSGTHRGMDGSAQEGFMLRGLVVELPEKLVFVKMVGPERIVREQRDEFVRFCKSLE